ncbi:MAG: GNAT family N-acetyltransferase [Woeseiaceae bacterium]
MRSPKLNRDSSGDSPEKETESYMRRTVATRLNPHLMSAHRVSVTVRHATEDDVERIFELIKAIAEHHDQSHYVLTEPNELSVAGFGADPKFGALIAEYDDNIVGFLSYTVSYSIWLGRNYMHIDDVFVDEHCRGKNIGETLMREARKYCESLDISRIKWEVQTDNHGAKRFYKRLGAKYYEKGVFAWDWSD